MRSVATAADVVWDRDLAEDLIPLVIPVGEEGNQLMIGFHRETLQIVGIGTPRNRQTFSTPGHVFRLIIKPTGIRDRIEVKGVSLYEPAAFEDLDVEVDDKLHFVFLCREEETFQVVKIVDDGI